MKTCLLCLRQLPDSHFGKDVSRSDGLHTYCKECRSRRHRSRVGIRKLLSRFSTEELEKELALRRAEAAEATKIEQE